MKRISLVVALLILGGCASTPVAMKDAQRVPADRVYAYQTRAPEKTAEVTVIRDTGIVGSACHVGVWLNKTFAAKLETSETATFHVEPGEVLLRVGSTPDAKGLCSLGDFGVKQYETLMHPGERKAFRVMTSHDAQLDITRADAE